MKIFDAHIHARNTKPDPVKLLERMAEAGVDGGCVFSTRPLRHNMSIGYTIEQRREELYGWSHGYEDRLIPVLWIHPYEAGILDIIRAAKDDGVRAFKIICGDFYPNDTMSLRVAEEIAKSGLPVFYHSGILYPSKAEFCLTPSQYNRPLHWEAMINVDNLRFSLAHCSWPWIDECIALWGEVNYFRHDMGRTTEMFMDACPGAHGCYRDDLFKKIYTLRWGIEKCVMWGRDGNADNYHVEAAKKLIAQDTALLDQFGATEEDKEKYFYGNLMRFLG